MTKAQWANLKDLIFFMRCSLADVAYGAHSHLCVMLDSFTLVRYCIRNILFEHDRKLKSNWYKLKVNLWGTSALMFKERCQLFSHWDKIPSTYNLKEKFNLAYILGVSDGGH